MSAMLKYQKCVKLNKPINKRYIGSVKKEPLVLDYKHKDSKIWDSKSYQIVSVGKQFINKLYNDKGFYNMPQVLL